MDALSLEAKMFKMWERNIKLAVSPQTCVCFVMSGIDRHLT